MTAALISVVVVVAVIFVTVSKYLPNIYTLFNLCGFLNVGISYTAATLFCNNNVIIGLALL